MPKTLIQRLLWTLVWMALAGKVSAAATVTQPPPRVPDEVIRIREDGRDQPFRVSRTALHRVNPTTGRSEIIPAPGNPDLALLAAAARQLEAASRLPHDLLLDDPATPGANRVVSRLVHVETVDPANDEALRTLGAAQAVLRHAVLPPTHRVLRFATAADALAALARIRADPSVVDAQPLLGRKPALQFTPNDFFYAYNPGNPGYQWHLRNTGHFDGTTGIDCNVANVWDSWKGSGIRVAVVDSGLETSHPDLTLNCDKAADHDFLDDSPDDPMGENSHGTASAGVIAARGNNTAGTTGVAMHATLVGLRLIDNIDINDHQIMEAMAWPNVHVSSNSWGFLPGGPYGTYPSLRGFGSLPVAAIESGAANGRGGLGTIYVFSSGNYASYKDDANYTRHQTLLPVISVGAVNDHGEKSSYSNPGACLLVCAPSSDGGHQGITTTTFTENGSYYHGFGGTSSACPTVSGAIALLLQSNPGLGWRDVQEILIRSARKNHASDPGWSNNGAGFHFHHSYGAGLIDTQAAVSLGTGWTKLGVQQKRELGQGGLDVDIPDDNASGISRSFSFSAGANIRVEHVQVETNITHTRRGDLEITLTSPSGMTSALQGATSDPNPDTNWTFKSVRHWGENSQGTWTIKIADRKFNKGGSLKKIAIRLFGTSPAPATAPSFADPAASLQGNQASIFYHQFSADNNPTSFAIDQTIPGITLEPVSGAWSGTPTQTGSFRRTVTATNSAGSDSQTVNLTILPPKPEVVPAIYPAMVGVQFSRSPQINGSPTSVSYSGLPPGLVALGRGFLISGTPSQAGSFVVAVSATNPHGTGTASILIKVAPESTALSAALDTPDRIWFSDAATPWTVWGAAFASDSVDCARSAPLSQLTHRSPLETIVEGPLAMRFRWRHSGHPSNVLGTELYVNDEELDYLSNASSWTQTSSYNFPAGSHLVRWDPRVVNLNPNNPGDSYFWLDQCQFDTPEAFAAEATDLSGSWRLYGDSLLRFRTYNAAGESDTDAARTSNLPDGGY